MVVEEGPPHRYPVIEVADVPQEVGPGRRDLLDDGLGVIGVGVVFDRGQRADPGTGRLGDLPPGDRAAVEIVGVDDGDPDPCRHESEAGQQHVVGELGSQPAERASRRHRPEDVMLGVGDVVGDGAGLPVDDVARVSPGGGGDRQGAAVGPDDELDVVPVDQPVDGGDRLVGRLGVDDLEPHPGCAGQVPALGDLERGADAAELLFAARRLWAGEGIDGPQGESRAGRAYEVT